MDQYDAFTTPQTFLWTIDNLSSPGKPITNGDAVSISAYSGGPDHTHFARIRCQAAPAGRGRDFIWQASPEPVSTVTNLSEVFGVYAVKEDEIGGQSLVRLLSSAPMEGNRRVALVPQKFQNTIAPGATALGDSDRAPRGAPPGPNDLYVTDYGGLNSNGVAIVYLREHTLPVPVFGRPAGGWFMARNQLRQRDYQDIPKYEWRSVCIENLIDWPNPANSESMLRGAPELANFWFLFRLSTRYGGRLMSSGEEVLLEAPNLEALDNRSAPAWDAVVASDGQLASWADPPAGSADPATRRRAIEKLRDWNYWVFKVGTWDRARGRPSVVPGPIYAGEPVILVPRTRGLEERLATGVWPENEIQGDLVEWVDPVVNRPLPAVSSILNVQPVKPATATMRLLQSGLNGVLLGMARTHSVPALVEVNGAAHLRFRGNGHGLSLGNGLRRSWPGPGQVGEDNRDFYAEGAYYQSRMTAGLYYDLTLSTDGSGPSAWGNLQRCEVAGDLEFPIPPQGFVWVAPPFYKMSGVCEAIASLDFHNAQGRCFIHAVVEAVLGKGTFGEGIFKPALSIPFPEQEIAAIHEHQRERTVENLNAVAPDPEDDSNNGAHRRPIIPPPRPPRWDAMADLLCIDSLSRLDAWKDRIKADGLRQQLNDQFKSDWFLAELAKFRDEMPNPVAAMAARYASYGGVVELMAALLTSEPVIDGIYALKSTDQVRALQVQLHILSALDRLRANDVCEYLSMALIARLAHDKPGLILKDYSETDLGKMILIMLRAAVNNPSFPQGGVIEALAKLVFGVAVSGDLKQILNAANQSVAEGKAVQLGRQLVLDAKRDLALEAKANVQQQLEAKTLDARRTELEARLLEAEAELATAEASRARNAGDLFVKVAPSLVGPTAVAAMRVLGTATAIYSLVSAGMKWTGSDADKVGLAGAILDGVGSAPGTANLLGDTYQLLRRKFSRGVRVAPYDPSIGRAGQAADVAAESADVGRLQAVLKSPAFKEAFNLLGPIADVLLIATSIIQLTQARDDWEKGLAGANLGVATTGLIATGMMTFAPEGSLAFAAAPYVLAAVAVAAVALMAVDACATDPEVKARRERQKNIQEWCRNLIFGYRLLKP